MEKTVKKRKKNPNTHLDQLLRSRKCPMCGKMFCASPLYVYRMIDGLGHKTDRYVCSYHCERESEKRAVISRQQRLEKARKSRAEARRKLAEKVRAEKMETEVAV